MYLFIYLFIYIFIYSFTHLILFYSPYSFNTYCHFIVTYQFRTREFIVRIRLTFPLRVNV